MAAYYNEIEPYAADWLRSLIREGLIADGEVDTRSIVDIRPADLVGFTQCHFFAGIGVWSYALRRAGWSDDRPVWTGSCPCQPFSAAGKGDGFADERHLWPHFHHLIRVCRPPVVLGEQVASKDGLVWLDLVHADLEGEGYAVGAADLCAAGVGAPHIRQRLWWVGCRQEGLEHAQSDGRVERRPEPGERGAAGGCGDGRLDDTDDARLEGLRGGHPAAGGHGRDAVRPVAAAGEPHGVADTVDDGQREHGHGVDRAPGAGEGGTRQRERLRPDPANGRPDGRLADADGRDASPEGLQRGGEQRFEQEDCGALRLADADGERADRRTAHETGQASPRPGCAGQLLPAAGAGGEPHGVADTNGDGPQGSEPAGAPGGGRRPADESAARARPGPTNGHWRDADWLLCRDGKWRPVEPGTFPLAHGAPARVGRLRAYGNAIVAQAAEAFIGSIL